MPGKKMTGTVLPKYKSTMTKKGKVHKGKKGKKKK
jgi:hypothetical protein